MRRLRYRPPATASVTRRDLGDDCDLDGLRVERDGGVVTLTIDRPERKNAITGEMWRGLAEIFDDLATRRDDRVLVITGAGDAFSSGADLTGAASGDAADAPAGPRASAARRRMRVRAALRRP